MQSKMLWAFIQNNLENSNLKKKKKGDCCAENGDITLKTSAK